VRISWRLSDRSRRDRPDMPRVSATGPGSMTAEHSRTAIKPCSSSAAPPAALSQIRMAERTPAHPIMATESGLVFVAQAQGQTNSQRNAAGPPLVANLTAGSLAAAPPAPAQPHRSPARAWRELRVPAAQVVDHSCHEIAAAGRVSLSDDAGARRCRGQAKPSGSHGAGYRQVRLE
jgi:hypothetical protein